MRRILVIAFAAAAVAGSAAPAFAGAWARGFLHSYHRLGVAYFVSERDFNDDGEIVDHEPDGKYYQDLSVAYYGELGVLDKLDFILNGVYKNQYGKMQVIDTETLNEVNREAEYGGFGDLEVALKYQFLEKLLAAAVQGTWKTPAMYDRDAKLPPGQGQNDFEARLALGRSLWPVPMYIGLEGAYRYRDNVPSDEWRYLAEAGASVWKLYARVKLDGIASAGTADDDAVTRDPQAGLEYALGKLEGTAGVKIFGPISLEGSYARTIYGRNTAHGQTIAGAVAAEF
ncbi:hypothetical protein K8I61_13505 [bacterium]|nr:hypothetical protein [bacterium]